MTPQCPKRFPVVECANIGKSRPSGDEYTEKSLDSLIFLPLAGFFCKSVLELLAVESPVPGTEYSWESQLPADQYSTMDIEFVYE
jgi:hypothetical protein